jgi:hypothetical protein
MCVYPWDRCILPSSTTGKDSNTQCQCFRPVYMLYLTRCGYMHFKRQALPKMGRGSYLGVHPSFSPTGHKTLNDNNNNSRPNNNVEHNLPTVIDFVSLYPSVT